MARRTKTYDNQSITALKGPDRVRKRPAVIFGSDGLEEMCIRDRPMIEAFCGYAIAGSAIAERVGKVCVDIDQLCEEARK